MALLDRRCDEKPGRTVPVIDRNRCEAKSDCVDVCPFDVFEVRKLTPDEKTGFSFVGRLKLAAHRGRQAFVVNPDACHACGLCATACPEKAIKLVAVGRLA
jgi:NAD-dependent dihydropyrimidine dehydrogenase PreA subunit